MPTTQGRDARAAEGRQNPYAALALHPKDNVATAVKDLTAGSEVSVQWPDGQQRAVTIRQDIPFGHKFALKEIDVGAEVRKYGERIGKTCSKIVQGEHVHVHNVESERGRGDLAGATLSDEEEELS